MGNGSSTDTPFREQSDTSLWKIIESRSLDDEHITVFEHSTAQSSDLLNAAALNSLKV